MDPMYHSFLVRFWTSESDEPPIWHISLESTRTREIRSFTSLEDLLNFFKELMRLPSASRRNPLGTTDQQSMNSTKTLPDMTRTRGGFY